MRVRQLCSFLQMVLIPLGHLHFHINLGSACQFLQKRAPGILIKSSNPWTQISFSFFFIFNFFPQVFLVWGVQASHFFCSFISKHFILFGAVVSGIILISFSYCSLTVMKCNWFFHIDFFIPQLCLTHNFYWILKDLSIICLSTRSCPQQIEIFSVLPSL